MNSDIPTYKVAANRFNGSPLGIFECRCGARHKHGLPSELNQPEHRVAHCTDRKIHPNGYYILWLGEEDSVAPYKKR
ncbi:hypothetical protein GCM10011415_06540 [Salipiger pallidus]|uniref:Uncharacterized protein n=1 Tax=Salipiger pallidus TaxID=1775170 RepID=A0A8J2ZHC0_9RHOB|nr:hypothetical protein GCM10011415_06540 [Salipiger pallidus]